MLTTILIALGVLAALFVVIVAMRPSTFRVFRSAAIAAPPEAAFLLVNDLRRFQQWSPWAKLDPNSVTTFEGPEAGIGASFSWSGNNKVGAGRMSLVESRPADFLRFKLEFLRPFKAINTTEFTFAPNGDQTLVTWTMTGDCNFMAKAFGLFVDCDNMVGKDFEKGLAQLKSLAEAAAHIPVGDPRLAHSGRA
jgi:hypothetical protein